ncbi:MAG: ABC transporter permease [Dysgonamonadaceae bacterium]|jgi:hypothetical protein|nr:ABC transporter permease [Dysgonamonadaceae bacterium]
MLSDDEPATNTLINEAAVKAFGWDQPVGKNFGDNHVKGVIKNIYASSPTVPVLPTFYRHSLENGNNCLLFKYSEREWKECKEKIDQWMKKEHPDMLYYAVANAEDTYNVFLKSEDALLKLLSFVSAVCVVICVFGFVSMITLTCEEQRKEIAIRKINGATMKNILTMYFKTYFLLLITGAVIAFPVGYFIMKRWMEQYVRQTPIGAGIYFSILLALTAVIVLCVGWRVYKASVENPAEVIQLCS